MNKKSANDLDRLIGARVRDARGSKGMSQEKLGDLLGLTFQQVQKYEKGMNRISAARLKQISELLGCPLLWLYGLDQDSGVIPNPHQQLAEKIAHLPSAEHRASVERVINVMLMPVSANKGVAA